MILSHITACAQNRVIGTQGTLPWDLPEDMKFFRDKTKGHIMIMGRKTFDSFGGKPLPNRYHIVVTRSPVDEVATTFEASTKSPVHIVASIEQAIEHARALTSHWGEEVFIIGGGEIYRQTMNIVDKIYLTVIHQDFDGDTIYPDVSPKDFDLVDQSPRHEPIDFTFRTYTRRSGAHHS